MAPTAQRPVVELRGISKLYGRGATLVRALDAVDLVVEHGDYVAVMGLPDPGSRR